MDTAIRYDKIKSEHWVVYLLLDLKISIDPASSLFRPRRFASRERRGFFIHVSASDMTPSDVWQGERGAALLKLARCTAAVDPLRPTDGLHELVIDGQSLAAARLLCVDLPISSPASSSVERYVRSGDLIVTYGETSERPLRPQIYWRATAHELHGAIAAIELLVSVQTSLLDAAAQLTTRSELAVSQAWQLTDERGHDFIEIAPQSAGAIATCCADRFRCFVFRLAAPQVSYIEMVAGQQAEQTTCSLATEGAVIRAQLHHRLFAERLEKGVILRARVLGVIVERGGDLAAAARHYAAFQAEALPLTT
jgi:hypothetical protein